MLPVDFLVKATQAANAVARLIVPRFEDGLGATHALSNKQKEYLGTGWLISSKHIITNHHVVNARDSYENDASPIDFELQAKSIKVQFDYDSESVVADTKTVASLIVADKVLDFAILELVEESNRSPLTLFEQTISMPKGAYIPVNIIQHPGGSPKQIAVRNNLIATIDNNNIAYFTDTKGGSSGSPVCNDQWQVVAIHKASTTQYGPFEYQGKNTSVVNIGTRIDTITSFIKDEYPNIGELLNL